MAAASREQASGIEQVHKAILPMDQTTQQNAALVEQTAAASHAMGEQAQQLQRLMAFFKLDQQEQINNLKVNSKLHSTPNVNQHYPAFVEPNLKRVHTALN